MPCTTRSCRRHRQGFVAQSGASIVEVLVTLVLSSVGFLGVAALQLVTLNNNQAIYFRAHASMLAASMLERIRTNDEGWMNAEYDDVDFNSTGLAGSKSGIDIQTWQREIDTTLPGGQSRAGGAIRRLPSSNRVAIMIRWYNGQNTAGPRSNATNTFELVAEL